MIIQWTQGANAQAPEFLGYAWTWVTGDGGAVVEPEPEVEPPPLSGAGGGEPYRTGGISGSAFIDERGVPRETQQEPADESDAAPEPRRSRETGPGLSSLLPRDQSQRQARADVRRERREQAKREQRETEAENERLIAWLEMSLAEARAADDAEVLEVYRLYRKRRAELVLHYLAATGRLKGMH